MKYFDPHRPDFSPYGFTCVQWTPSTMCRPDHHNEIELNIISKGSITYLLGSSKVRLEAGRLTAFWAAIPHQVIALEPDTHYFVATIPLAWFLQCGLPKRLTHSLMDGQLVSEPQSNRAEQDIRLFEQWQSDLATNLTHLKEIVMLEINARLRRLAEALPEILTDAQSRTGTKLMLSGLSKAEQIACYVAQRITEPLSATAIGKAVDLHPNYAMNLFRKTFGSTLMEFLAQHRISHAQRLLATTDLKMVDIALGSGFQSQSRFNETFKRFCKCSPRYYREKHRQASINMNE